MTPRPLAFVCLALVTLAGCETFAEPDPADFTPTLAVGGLFETGVPWSVLVSQTVALNDTSATDRDGVSTATVEVTGDDGSRVRLSHVGEGRYEAPEAPTPGRTYTLAVRAPGFPDVTATSIAPRPVGSLTIDVVRWTDQPGAADFEVTFDDPAAPGDLYEFSLLSELARPDGQPPLQSTSPFTTTAPVLRESTFLDDLQSGSRSPRYLSVFLDDAQQIASVPVTLTQVGPNDVVVVTLLVASREYYEAVRVQARQREAAQNPFAEPVPPYSNVRGGAGGFVGVARQTASARRDP